MFLRVGLGEPPPLPNKAVSAHLLEALRERTRVYMVVSGIGTL